DLQPVEVMPGGHPEMAATYLVGDSLAPGPADPQGYSVFYLADYQTERGYNPIYSEVHDYREDGKIALRLLDYLNWDDDEHPEMLLEVFKRNGQGYALLSQEGSGWAKVWEGAVCGGE